ncbi:MAG TPA: Trp biosynthesis-associated membrane protein [Beutenbergiaceae bacterium]|nr:Trp biosynthesis-associated membrane protein [Beutenbergiaceae bacterium]
MSRTTVVLLMAGMGLLAFGSSMLTWIHAEAATPLGPQPVAVGGAEAVPVVPSAALAIVVAGLAMGLSGKVVRYLAPAAAVLAAVVGLVGVIGVLRDPNPAARSAAAEVGGVREISGMAELTAWPWVAAALLVLTGLVAAVLPLLAGTWAPAARKYERTPASAGKRADHPPSPQSDWDALSSGQDPTVDDDGDPEPPAEAPAAER